MKLYHLGIIYSNEESNKPQLQKIDDVNTFKIENEIEEDIPQLSTDEQAREILQELVIDNYIETIHQDLNQGDRSLIYALLNGDGIKPINILTDEELYKESIEVGIINE